jgi:hypothetical protein
VAEGLEESVSDTEEAQARRLESDEEMVEYEDEFGRTRTAPLSEVPREFLPNRYREQLGAEGDVAQVLYGPATSFPVYDPSVHTKAPPASSHFDATLETRHRGAAFYRFSRTEHERNAQMAELASLRQETLAQRGGAPHASPAPPDPVQRWKQRLRDRTHFVQQARLDHLGPSAVQQRTEAIAQARIASVLPQP